MTHAHALQTVSLPTATRNGTHWTETELDKIKTDRSIAELAAELNRTWYAVASARRVTSERAERASTVARKAELPYDRGFTTLEAMGF